MRLETLQGLERLDWLATRYHQRPSSLVGIQSPDTAYRFDEAVLLAGVFAEERIRREARAEAGLPNDRRTGEHETPAAEMDGAYISYGEGGMTLKGTVPITHDRTPEEIERAEAWRVKQGWKKRTLDLTPPE